MYRDLSGKTALVTGAGKKTGIGYAIARKLAACGANVIIADLGESTDPANQVNTGTTREMNAIAEGLQKEYGIQTTPVDLDVTSNTSVDKMMQKISKQYERLDVLCNNAGAAFGVPNALHTYDESAWMKTIDVNLHGVFRVSRALIPLMMKNGGSIINTSSKAAKSPPPFNGAYAVAKAGVSMLTKVMALELAGTGIRVNAVCPGVIQSDLTKWRFELEAQVFNTTAGAREEEMCRNIPLGRLGTPDDVASLVAFLASNESSYITGQAFNIAGGQLMEA